MIQKMKARLQNQKGFSILELIIVIAVIGILVALIFPRLGALTGTARTNADAGNGRIIAAATAEAVANAEVAIDQMLVLEVGTPPAAASDELDVVNMLNGATIPTIQTTGFTHFLVQISDDGDIAVAISANNAYAAADDTLVFGVWQ